MKTLHLNKNTDLIQFKGTAEWYYSLSFMEGDLYEAEDNFKQGYPVKGRDLFAVHYPDGEAYQLVEATANQYCGDPKYIDGRICFLLVDFAESTIHIKAFDAENKNVSTIDTIPLGEVKDCYNLAVDGSPLMVTRSGAYEPFEIIWPKKKTYEITDNEYFFHQTDGKMYFSKWVEDPTYRDIMIVRDKETGEIIETLNGDIHQMPNGEFWLVEE